MTLYYASISVELREVFLKEKPPSMLAVSSKGTVPVLITPEGAVLDESVDVMHWGLQQSDPDNWWREETASEAEALVKENDFGFKVNLDHYKYWTRFPAQSQFQYRVEAEKFLRQLEVRLSTQKYLMDDDLTYADVAIFPFIRQFAFVDKTWFDQSPYPKLQHWLESMLVSNLFTKVMGKLPTWKEGDIPVIFPGN